MAGSTRDSEKDFWEALSRRNTIEYGADVLSYEAWNATKPWIPEDNQVVRYDAQFFSELLGPLDDADASDTEDADPDRAAEMALLEQTAHDEVKRLGWDIAMRPVEQIVGDLHRRVDEKERAITAASEYVASHPVSDLIANLDTKRTNLQSQMALLRLRYHDLREADLSGQVLGVGPEFTELALVWNEYKAARADLNVYYETTEAEQNLRLAKAHLDAELKPAKRKLRFMARLAFRTRLVNPRGPYGTWCTPGCHGPRQTGWPEGGESLLDYIDRTHGSTSEPIAIDSPLSYYSDCDCDDCVQEFMARQTEENQTEENQSEEDQIATGDNRRSAGLENRGWPTHITQSLDYHFHKTHGSMRFWDKFAKYRKAYPAYEQGRSGLQQTGWPKPGQPQPGESLPAFGRIFAPTKSSSEDQNQPPANPGNHGIRGTGWARRATIVISY